MGVLRGRVGFPVGNWGAASYLVFLPPLGPLLLHFYFCFHSISLVRTSYRVQPRHKAGWEIPSMAGQLLPSNRCSRDICVAASSASICYHSRKYFDPPWWNSPSTVLKPGDLDEVVSIACSAWCKLISKSYTTGPSNWVRGEHII